MGQDSMKTPARPRPRTPLPLESDQELLLGRPPEAAIRMLALPFLDEAAAAASLLESDTDAGALHDFRVALRRLRTLLKAYRGLLVDSVSKKQARALRDLARSTGAARDAEVQLEWLVAQREDLKPAARRACSWIMERLEARRQAAYSAVRGDALQGFSKLERNLRLTAGSPPPWRRSATASASTSAENFSSCSAGQSARSSWNSASTRSRTSRSISRSPDRRSLPGDAASVA